MTFKIDLTPVVNFCNEVPTYAALVEWWHVYILLFWVLGFYVLPRKWKSVPAMAVAPVWLPFYYLGIGLNYAFSFAKSFLSFRSNVLMNMQEFQTLLESCEVELKNIRTVSNHSFDTLDEVENDIANLSKKLEVSLNEISKKTDGFQNLSESDRTILKKLDELSKKNTSTASPTVTTYPAPVNGTVLTSGSGHVVHMQDTAQSTTDLSALQKALAAFSGLSDDWYIAVGSLKKADTYDFSYAFGIRLGALRKGVVKANDICMPPVNNDKTLTYKVKYVLPNGLPVISHEKA